MTTIQMSDLPEFSWDATTPSMRRRSVLRGMFGLAIGASLALVGSLSTARPALANYTIRDSCTGNEATHNCSPGCGPSMVCSDCCGTRPGGATCEPAPTSSAPCLCGKWHRVVVNTYSLRPNECGGSPYDGWNWRYASSCGCCNSGTKFRCHDGEKKIGGTWYNSICKSLTGCSSCTCS